jgi:hypothetical protein
MPVKDGPPNQLVSALRDLKRQIQDPSANETPTAKNVDLTFCFDGGTGPINVGSHVYLKVDFACRISGWFIIADPAGTIAFDLNAGPFTSFPTIDPVIGVGGTSPNTAAAQAGAGDITDLTGWTLDIPMNSVVEAIVSANDSVGVATLALRCKRLDLF